MIHTRVLELLKNPKNIQSEDLDLLKQEINSFPYIQNIRALHLYGVHLFDRENYQKALSSTAAYTTDKKILYQLINGKTEKIKPQILVEKQEDNNVKEVQQPIEETKNAETTDIHEEEVDERKAPKSFADYDYEAASEGLLSDQPEIKHLVVNGERNRILFDGEENFLDENDNDIIDLESTLESGVIVTHKAVSHQNNFNETDKEEAIIAEELAGTSSETPIPETQVKEITDNAELNLETSVESDFKESPETLVAAQSEVVINEDKINSERIAEKVNDVSEVSFQKIESFPAETEVFEQENTQAGSNKGQETIEALNPELIIEEEKIESQQVAERINDDAELSFHGTESFLPEVKIESNKTADSQLNQNLKSNVNKHEDEMRRLIEEVEKRMKSKKDSETHQMDIEKDEINTEISFAETQAFHVGEEQKAAEDVVVKTAELIVEEKLEEEKAEHNIDVENEKIVVPQSEAGSTWKPMSFETSRPDSLLNKPIETVELEEILKTEETPISEPPAQSSEKQSETENESIEPAPTQTEEEVEITEKQSTEAPLMNVSFFGSDIASLGLSYKSDQKEKADAKEQEAKITQQKIDDSNVPGFINTWQSWLKIDRAEENPVNKTEIKNKVIESFIENNPKISQLKDEVNFVVKEKTDDISHLMTETLANLYIEQKLYSKAINAFLTLANKYPDRKQYFEEKVQDIKDSRNKN